MKPWLLVLTLLALGCGTSRPNDPYLGAPTYRVLEADQVDSPELLLEFQTIHAQVERCLGEHRDHDRLTFYRARLIIALDTSGAWAHPLGIATIEHRIYFQWSLTPRNRRQAVAHELAHYVMRMGHPDIDPLLEACLIPVTITLDRPLVL